MVFVHTYALENLCERTHFHQQKKIPTKISRICHGTKSSMKQTRWAPTSYKWSYNPLFMAENRWVCLGLYYNPCKWSEFQNNWVLLQGPPWTSTSAQQFGCWAAQWARKRSQLPAENWNWANLRNLSFQGFSRKLDNSLVRVASTCIYTKYI